MRSDAVHGMARISLSIYSCVVGLRYVKQCGVAWSCRVWQCYVRQCGEVLGRARISLSIYSAVAVQCYVRQGHAMQRIAWKGKDSLINFLLGNPQFGHAMWCLALPCAAMR